MSTKVMTTLPDATAQMNTGRDATDIRAAGYPGWIPDLTCRISGRDSGFDMPDNRAGYRIMKIAGYPAKLTHINS
jgi:hypothetical protein